MLHREGSLFEQDILPYMVKGNIALIAINFLVFLFSDFFEVKVMSQSLIELGGLSWNSVLDDGEYYRIISSMFLHADSSHIFNNMLTLVFIGSFLEQQIGTWRYLAVYFFSGIVAGCSSMGYNMMLGEMTLSVGASGAIFGVMGGLLCLIIMNHNLVCRSDISKIFIMVFMSLYCGFASEGVDNAAHVGGFVGGFLLTGLFMFLMKRKSLKGRRTPC